MNKLIGVLALSALLAACSTSEKEMAPEPAPAPEPVTAPEPVGPAPESAEYFETVVGDRIFFGFDEYELTSDAQSTLSAQAAWLNQNPSRALLVEGHADERGTREYNIGLGERRANAAREYLVSLGVAPSRIRTISYGKERPTCVASSESCWSQNRRAVSVVE